MTEPITNKNLISVIHNIGALATDTERDLAARLEAAEAEIARLKNPGQTRYCAQCEAAGKEIERLKKLIIALYNDRGYKELSPCDRMDIDLIVEADLEQRKREAGDGE